MAQTINTNIASLNAQRNLNTSQNALNTSLQRLSSGLRINSAKDDAAGLAISERFTAQIRGLNQAARNANDGISLAQTGEGALGEVTNNLQRIRELAVQSANATNSSSDRAALDAEVQQLISEIDRVASQTNFNGVKLLDGSFSSQLFQVGANVGDTITLSAVVDSTALGLGLDTGGAATADITGGAITAELAAGDLTVNGSDVGVTATAGGDAAEVAAAINAVETGIATASNSITFAFAAVSETGGTNPLTYDLDVNGTGIATQAIAASGSLDAATLAGAIDALTGITATDDGSGNITISTDDGSNLILENQVIAGTGTSSGAGVAGADLDVTTVGTVDISSAANVEIAGTDPSKAGFTAETAFATSNINLLSVANSNAAITAIDTALTSINSARADLGAIQNRFESVVTSLQTTSENLSASRSRIQDADFAAETANLTRAQILQQAGTAMLAQANALPQNVLALLQ
tara:strand:+ start:67683 stop:69086 length:1404 start_codon:yes stop_codon:yes gene_type:complete